MIRFYMTCAAFATALLVSLSLNAASTKNGVSFAAPKDGATVTKTFKVKFDLKGMKIRPAGENIEEKTTGHHHVLIDTGAIPEGQVIPADTTHIHYGKGQTEAELTLPPGKHTLTLQFADGAHRSYGEKMSATINVTVKE